VSRLQVCWHPNRGDVQYGCTVPWLIPHQQVVVLHILKPNNYVEFILSVLDLVSWVRNVVLINVYLDLGNSRGSGFWIEGHMSQGWEMGN
jgi:hypothetical protein